MTTRYPTLATLDVQNKAVLVRVDFNIPPLKNGGVSDDFRLQAHVPTIRMLVERGARVVLLTHRGRPQGRVVPELSTRPLAEALTVMLNHPVAFVPDCVGRVAEEAVRRLQTGEILLLENTRFHVGEMIADRAFTMQLAALGDIFVNDAFAAAHRPHASVSGLATYFKKNGKPSVIGPLMEKEITWLERVMQAPKRPFTAILGGAQVPQKLDVIRHLLTKVDTLMLAGAVAHTFLASRDLGLGRSLLDPSSVEYARDIFTEAGVVGCRLLLPQDLVLAGSDKNQHARTVVPVAALRPDDAAMDIGPATVATWSKVIQGAGTVLWLGSVGAFETESFNEGTLNIANAVLHSPAFSLVAGDGLLRALKQGDLRHLLPNVSSGSAVTMAALTGQKLPGLAVFDGAHES